MEKRYDIPFGPDTLQVTLPQEQVIFYATPNKPEAVGDADAAIEAALDAPYGTAPIEALVHPGQKLLVLMDDITRPTPKGLLLRHLLGRLSRAGIPDADVLLAFAPGTHRPLTAEEMQDLLGEEILKRFRILNRSYKQTECLVHLGDTPSGIPIDVYREALEADCIIGIGNIVPHVSAGWGGGAKIVQPGICGERTTKATHLMAALEQNVMETCGNAENRCRHEMEAIARQVGLQFVINTVMDEEQHILGVFCGDCVAAHRAGVALARQVLCPAIPRQADILIASANPCEIDFWQGDKPYVFAQYGLREGGTLIFVIEGTEGLCGNAPEHEQTVRRYCLQPEEVIRADVARGVIDDPIAVDLPIYHDQIRRRGIDVLLVSRGFTQRDADDLGFVRCDSLEQAVERALQKQGNDAAIGIIPYCGETLVRVAE